MKPAEPRHPPAGQAGATGGGGQAWLLWLLRGLLLAVVAVVAVALVVPNTWLAAVRLRFRWLSDAISLTEQVWPAIDMVHAVLFAAMGLLAALAFPAIGWRRLLLGIAVLACTSEFVQIWVPGRTASVGEALLDIVAAVLGIGVVAGLRQLAVWRRSRPEHGRQSARP